MKREIIIDLLIMLLIVTVSFYCGTLYATYYHTKIQLKPKRERIFSFAIYKNMSCVSK